MDYLGHKIPKEGVKFDPSKIKATMEWTKIDNILKLRGFLGLIGYYRIFLNNYAHKTAPLTNLLKKNSFQWNSEVEKCFETLKCMMSSNPVLPMPNFTKPFVVECDASGFRLGEVLMQEGNPIAFESRKLNKRESLKSTYDKERLAIVHAIKKW